MYSLRDIQRMAGEAAARAEETGLEPYEVTSEDLEKWKECLHFPFPFIGEYDAHGWTPTLDEDGDYVEYFVDATGLDKHGPAITPDELLERLQVGKGYAITEAGQFQVYVREYERC